MKNNAFKRFVLPLFLAVVLAVYCIPAVPAAAEDAINVNGNFIFGLSAYKRVADVKAIAGSDVSVKDKDGNVLLVTEAKYVGTNFKLKRAADDEYRIIIVKGDVNGDGSVNAQDSLSVKANLSGISAYVCDDHNECGRPSRRGWRRSAPAAELAGTSSARHPPRPLPPPGSCPPPRPSPPPRTRVCSGFPYSLPFLLPGRPFPVPCRDYTKTCPTTSAAEPVMADGM